MIDILIPVLRRPLNARRVATSITVTTRNPYTLYFICSPGDHAQIEACRNVSLARTLVVKWKPGAGDYARKINWGCAQSEAPWVFQGADDIIFSTGWDEEALKVARVTGARVIGTNDLHNPKVLRGAHSTHTLIARSYVEEYEGYVLCEEYDHQYVDNELVELAKRRGEWAFAKKAIVEHLHPHYGDAERDSTYTKAFRKSNDDRKLYKKRMGS